LSSSLRHNARMSAMAMFCWPAWTPNEMLIRASTRSLLRRQDT
jgi:hypothetical protein